MKTNDGRKTRKSGPDKEKHKLDREFSQITKIIEKRKQDSHRKYNFYLFTCYFAVFVKQKMNGIRTRLHNLILETYRFIIQKHNSVYVLLQLMLFAKFSNVCFDFFHFFSDVAKRSRY